MLHAIVVHPFDYERTYVLSPCHWGGGQIATIYVTNHSVCVF